MYPMAASASSLSDDPTAAKKTTSTGGAPRCTAARRVSPCATAMFSITSPAATAARSGSNSCRAAHLAQHRAHAEQHQGHFASDVAHVEREQRADQHTERDRAADLPREAHERRRRPPPSVPLNTTRAICIENENSTSSTRSARTTIVSTVSLNRPRAPVSVITAAVMVGEKLTRITDQQHDHRQPRRAGRLRRDRQPRPRQPEEYREAGHRDRQRDAGHLDDAPRAGGPCRSRFRVSPAMSAISVVAMPVITWSWPAIDSVMTLPRYGPTTMPKSR